MLKVNPYTAMRYVEANHHVRASVGEHQVRVKVCPNCGNEKWSCSFKSTTQVFTSFCCDKNIGLFELVRKDQGLVGLRKVLEHLKAYGTGKLVWVTGESGEEVSKGETIKHRVKALMRKNVSESISQSMDMTGWSTNWETKTGSDVLAYARQRRVPEWFVESGRFGYFESGMMQGRAAFLTVENDVPVFAVARALGNYNPKYLSMHPDKTGGVGSSDVVFNLDLCDEGDFITIHEGVLSALSGPEGSVATFGKGISAVQVSKIKQVNPEGVLLLQEPGVSSLLTESHAYQFYAKGIYTIVASLINGDMNDDDTQFDAVMENAREVDKMSLIRARLMTRKVV